MCDFFSTDYNTFRAVVNKTSDTGDVSEANEGAIEQPEHDTLLLTLAQQHGLIVELKYAR